MRLLLALGLLALTACSGGGDCRLNSDCQLPYECVNGRCVVECRADRDCASAFRCTDGRCVERVPDARLCSSARDCGPGEACVSGVCGEPVAPVDAGTLPPDSGVEPPRDGGEPGPSDAGGIDAGPADAGAGPTGLPYGAVCGAASECASRLCLGPQGSPTGRCTEFCQTDQECYYPDRCTPVPGVGNLCAAPDGNTGLPPGAACPGGPNDCASGLCLALPNQTPICTQNCATLPACPPGLVCAPLPDGAGGAVPVCVPGSGGGFGETCTAASQCATQLCLGAGSSGVCTAPCHQIPCPQGYTCTAVQDGAGTIQLCAPNHLVGGNFGDACNAASECQSGLCLNDARLGFAYCTRSCVSNADCAQIQGLACVTLQGGQRVCALP